MSKLIFLYKFFTQLYPYEKKSNLEMESHEKSNNFILFSPGSTVITSVFSLFNSIASLQGSFKRTLIILFKSSKISIVSISSTLQFTNTEMAKTLFPKDSPI